MITWTRQPMPGEPIEDTENRRIGVVVRYESWSDIVVISDTEGNEWEVPLSETCQRRSGGI